MGHALIEDLLAARSRVRALDDQWPSADASEEEKADHWSTVQALEDEVTRIAHQIDVYLQDLADAVDSAADSFTNVTSQLSHGNRFDSRADWDAYLTSAHDRAREINQLIEPWQRLIEQLAAAGENADGRPSPRRRRVHVPEYDWHQINRFDEHGRRWIGGREDGRWVAD